MSTQRVTPDGMVIGPVTNALFEPVVVSRTECAEAQPVSAAWMRAVSRVVSLGTPVAETTCDAVIVVHAGGMVGWAGSAVSPAQRGPLPASTVAPLLLLELLLLAPLELLLLAAPASLTPPLLLELLDAPASFAPLLLELVVPPPLPLDEFPAVPLLLPVLDPVPELLLPPFDVPELDALLLDEPSPGPPPSPVSAALPHATGPDTDNTTATAPSHR